jgi:fibronectin-binding autotransporter adhesin
MSASGRPSAPTHGHSDSRPRRPIASTRRNAKALYALSAAALLASAQLTHAADRTWNGGGPNNSWTTALNWIGGVAPVANDSVTFDGFITANVNNFAPNVAFNGITFASTAGAFTLSGNAITLHGDLADNTPLLTQTIALGLGLDATRNVSVVDQGFLTLSGAITESAAGSGLTKTGNGTLTLSGTNTFTGPVTVNAGVLSVSSAANLGTGPAAPTANSLVLNGGTMRVTGNFTLSASRGVALGPAGSAGAGTFDINTGNTLIYQGIIANNTGGTGSLNKYRFGTLTLSGANTYTGATNVANGALILNFADTAATTPVTNIIAPSSGLSLGGSNAGLGQDSNATLVAVGKASAANVQTFANTNINVGGAVIAATKGTGGSMQVNLGNLTHTLGGTLVVPTLGTPTFGSGNTAFGSVTTSTSVASTHGILGGWAVAGTFSSNRGIISGTDWATVDGSGNIVAYTGYVAAPTFNAGDASTLLHNNATIAANADKNLRLAATGATDVHVDADNANTTTDINTFAFTTAGANNELTIGAGNTLRLGVYGGILKQATGNNQLYVGGPGGLFTGNGSSPNVGNLTAGGPTTGTPGEIVLSPLDTANNNGGMNILASIVDNGPGGTVTLIKTGVMSVKIDGHNTFSGGVFINQGRFQLAGGEAGAPNPDGLGSGRVTVAPGGYLFVSGVNNATIVFNGPGAIPGAIANTAQNCPIPNNMTLAGNGDNQEPIGAIRLGSRSLFTGEITLGGDARISGTAAAAYPAINADGTTLYVDPGNEFRGRITGPYSLDVGAAVSVATNFVISNPANDWNGNTNFVSGGGTSRLRLGNNEVIPDGPGKGNLVWGTGVTGNQATLDMNGFNETVNGLSTTTANPGSAMIENDGFTATLTGVSGSKSYVFTANTSVLTVGGFDQSATFGGVIRDSDTGTSVTLPDPNTAGATVSVVAPWANPTTGSAAKIALRKIGNGLQVLSGSNTYTGGTTIDGGTLSIIGSLNNTGAIQVNNGGALAGATGNNLGTVTVASGGHISPGAAGTGSTGSITLSSVTLNKGSALNLDLTAPGSSDMINTSAGTLNFGGGSITIGLTGTPATGVYTVLQSGAALTLSGGTAANFNVIQFPTVPNSRGFHGDVSLTSNSIVLNVIGAAHLRWLGSAGSNWDLNNTPNFANLDNANATDKFFTGDIVTFDDSATNRNVTILGALVPNGVLVDTGGTYNFSGSGSIGGSTGLTKQGGGTLIISNANAYTGPTNLNGGTLVLANGGSLGSGTIVANSILALANTGSISFANPITNGGDIRVVGGGTVLFSSTLSDHSGQFFIQSGVAIPAVANINNGTLSSFGRLDGGSVNVLPGGAVDVNGPAAANALNFGNKEFHITGDGVPVTVGTVTVNSGALTNSGTTSQQNAYQRITLDGDASIGGTGRFDIRYTQPSGDPSPNAQLSLNNHTLTKNGSNQFSIVNANIGGGTIVVNSGTLGFEATTNADNNGLIVLNAGTTLQFFNLLGTNPADPSNTSPSINRPIRVNGANVLMGNNSATASLLGSPIILAGGDLNIASFTASPGTLTFTGGITETGGARNLIKNGASVFVETGNSTYTGTTTVNAGTLRVNGTHTGGGAYTVASGATLSGIGTISAQVNVSAGGIVHPGTAATINNSGSFITSNSIGTLTVGGLSLTSSILAMDGSNAGMDRVNVTNTDALTLSGVSTVNFVDLGGLTAGTFTLVDYAGTPLSNLNNFQVGSMPLGFGFSLVNNTANTSVDVAVSTVAVTGSVWNLNANGNWSVDANWSGGVPNAVGATANFGSVITAARTVTVDAAETVGTINFSNPNSYTIAGSNALTLDVSGGNAAINVLVGSHTISAPLTLAKDTTITSAAGTGVAITGAMTATGKTITKAGAGSVQFENVRSAGLAVTGGSAKISAKGSPNSSAGTSVVQSLSISGGASLDLTNNSAVVDYTGSVGTLVGDVRQHLQSGRLTSSNADASHRLGYGANAVLNKATFAGQTVDTSSILIKYTFAGDSNLDGQVDVTDLGALATSWQTSAPWTGGDFNYDGFVDVSDLGLLATNWQLGVGSPLGPGSLDAAMAAVGLGNVSVPEPASVGLIGIGILGLVGRRRRRAD